LTNKNPLFSRIHVRVCLVQIKGGEGRDFNEGEGKGGEGRGDSLLKYMFGSKEGRGGEVRYFN
jgi:hypothetical protein